MTYQVVAALHKPPRVCSEAGSKDERLEFLWEVLISRHCILTDSDTVSCRLGYNVYYTNFWLQSLCLLGSWKQRRGVFYLTEFFTESRPCRQSESRCRITDCTKVWVQASLSLCGSRQNKNNPKIGGNPHLFCQLHTFIFQLLWYLQYRPLDGVTSILSRNLVEK